MWPVLLLIPWLFGLGLAQSWRLAQSQSTTLREGGAWRYTLSPVGKEAKALWQELSLAYQDLLRAGHRVDLGRWRLYFLGGRLRFEPHCPKATLPCFTLAKVAYEPLRLEGFFHELDTLLGRALSEAQKKPKARLTLTRLVRLELEEGRIKAVKPSGWKPWPNPTGRGRASAGRLAFPAPFGAPAGRLRGCLHGEALGG